MQSNKSKNKGSKLHKEKRKQNGATGCFTQHFFYDTCYSTLTRFDEYKQRRMIDEFESNTIFVNKDFRLLL